MLFITTCGIFHQLKFVMMWLQKIFKCDTSPKWILKKPPLLTKLIHFSSHICVIQTFHYLQNLRKIQLSHFTLNDKFICLNMSKSPIATDDSIKFNLFPDIACLFFLNYLCYNECLHMQCAHSYWTHTWNTHMHVQSTWAIGTDNCQNLTLLLLKIWPYFPIKKWKIGCTCSKYHKKLNIVKTAFIIICS